MKRKNFKRSLVSYIVIWSIFLSSLLLYSPINNIALSASGVPEIKIFTPNEGTVLDVSTVEFTGRVSEALSTPDKLLVKVFEQQGDSQQPVDITEAGKLSITIQEQYADFTFSKDFSEGVHHLTFVVTDENGVSSKMDSSFTVSQVGTIQQNTATNTEASTTVTEPVNQAQASAAVEEIVTTPTSQATTDETGKRPYMAKMFLIPKGSEDKYQPGEAEPSSYLPAEDMTRIPLDYEILIDVRSMEPLTETQPLITFFGEFKGKEKLVKSSVVTDNLKSYIYTFTPDQDFLPKTTYYVYLNPKFSTETGIGITPRYLKFTTVSDYKDSGFQVDRVKDESFENDYIHGPFSVVSNSCAFCHSTHNGTNEFLVNKDKGSNENDMCMACHDGTGSPKIEDNSKHSKHYTDPKVSCSSCHDPHNPGTKENPSSIHRMAGGQGSVYSYKKASTASGDATDYTLCFSCHTAGKNTNIEKYYTDATYKSQSGHNIQATADSGSTLNGQLPCAECHETHGAENLKILRTDLGNAKISTDEKKFKSVGDVWNATNERNFCLKCHTQSTNLYGKTAKFKEKDELDQTIIGHRIVEDKDQSCASCHGGQSKSFIDAAHSPVKLTK